MNKPPHNNNNNKMNQRAPTPTLAQAQEMSNRFNSDSDDVFMRSMIQNYAAELKDDDTKVPTGKFFMNAASARRAGTEIVGTHMGLSGAALKGYTDKYFQRVWDHFDVNGSGMIEVEKMPQFARMLL